MLMSAGEHHAVYLCWLLYSSIMVGGRIENMRPDGRSELTSTSKCWWEITGRVGGVGITFQEAQKSMVLQDKLKKELLAAVKANKQPKLIRCDQYDQKAAFEAMELSVLLYGRQPLAGYQQGSGRPEDDDKNALAGAGTRTHRFVIRLSKLAALLLKEKKLLELGPVPILELIPQLLQTNSVWKPYQAQLVLKRFLLFKYSRNMHCMQWTNVARWWEITETTSSW